MFHDDSVGVSRSFGCSVVIVDHVVIDSPIVSFGVIFLCGSIASAVLGSPVSEFRVLVLLVSASSGCS